MSWTFWVKLHLLTVPIFVALDLLWLGVVAKGFYQRQLEPLLAPRVNWTSAVIFYFVYVAGILVFVVGPALERDSLPRAVVLGALFGLVTYATYDLTNMATLDGWPWVVVVVDVVWGTLLGAVVGTGSFLLARQLA